MTLVLNGTTGVSAVDGSAATPAIQGNDTNTGVFFPAADTVAVATGGTERMRVDSSGNVGIGVTPTVSAGVTELALGSASTNPRINGVRDGAAAMLLTSDSVGTSFYERRNLPLLLGTNNTERARFDANGNLLVGNSTASQTTDGLFVRGKVTATGNQWNFLTYTQGGQFTLGCRDDYYLRSPAVYDRTSGGAANVTVDSSGYFYRSTSSIRYKRDVVDYDKGLAAVSALRPVYYKSNVESPDGGVPDEQYAGFIAEEVAEAGLEEFVVRNDQGQPDALHYSNMVALLTKAIQEQQALIAALQADVAALKGQA